MIARMGAVADRSTKADMRPMPVMPTPTPISAVTSGRPMASTDPNAISSTTTAAPSPMSSELCPGGLVCAAAITSPPKETFTPAGAWARTVASSRRTACLGTACAWAV